MMGNTLQRVPPTSRQGDVTRLAVLGVLTTAIFLIDLLFPLGFAISMLYLFPIWFTLRLHRPRLWIVQASLCTGLILAGFYWSPPGQVTMDVVNRAVGVAVLWGVALLGFRRQQVEAALLAARNDLERRVQEGTADLTHSNQELRESEARLQAILDHSPTLIFLKDIEGRYLLVNQEFEHIFHLTRTDMMGKTDAELFSPGQAAAFRANDLKVLQANAPLQFEELALHDDGPHTSIVFKFPLRDEAGTPYAIGGITTDITDRTRAEHALRESEEDLRRLLEEREALSRDLHDNIIQTICAVGMGLEECQHVMRESPATAVQQLAQAIAGLNEVVRDVRGHLVSETTDAPSVLGYVQRELTRLTQTVENVQGPQFCVTVNESALHSLSQEVARQLMSITREAVSNSLKHSEASTVSVSLQEHGTQLRLAIDDDGVGFDPERWRARGHGLRNIAARTQQIGGTLHVMSQPQHGTHILVHFPGEPSNVRT